MKFKKITTLDESLGWDTKLDAGMTRTIVYIFLRFLCVLEEWKHCQIDMLL